MKKRALLLATIWLGSAGFGEDTRGARDADAMADWKPSPRPESVCYRRRGDNRLVCIPVQRERILGTVLSDGCGMSSHCGSNDRIVFEVSRLFSGTRVPPP